MRSWIVSKRAIELAAVLFRMSTIADLDRSARLAVSSLLRGHTVAWQVIVDEVYALEQYDGNRAQLAANAAAHGGDRAAGPPRDGSALLQAP